MELEIAYSCYGDQSETKKILKSYILTFLMVETKMQIPGGSADRRVCSHTQSMYVN